MHYLIKEFAPPILNTLRWYSSKYGWKGNYPSFDAAKKLCKGYDEDHIVRKIAETTLAVVSGDAVYERDGILYDEINVNHQLLAALLLVAGRNDGKLTIIDFGGSLGTSYYQNIGFLSHLKEINWCIIEQSSFVEVGKNGFENEHIKFYHDLGECFADQKEVNIVLISSSLQYMPKPYEILAEIQNQQIPYLMLDLVGFNDKNVDRITIQHVPPIFYGVEAAYPCTFFSKLKLYQQLENNYNKVFEFISEHQKYYIELKPFRYEGSLWSLKK